jgi:hypothetical protein
MAPRRFSESMGIRRFCPVLTLRRSAQEKFWVFYARFHSREAIRDVLYDLHRSRLICARSNCIIAWEAF